MKIAKNKKFLLVIAMALVLSLSVGMTFAYFSDHTAASGEAMVALGGKTEIVEKVKDDGKDIKIDNIGDTDVLVRVGVYGPSTMTVTFKDDSDWTKVGNFYYYKKVLPKGGSTSEINALVTAPEDEVQNFDVIVVNECVQVTYKNDNSIYIPEDWDQGFLSN